MLKTFINFFSSFREILKLKKLKPKFIFFSEGKSYQKYSLILVETITEIYKDTIYYVSIDQKDKLNLTNVKNIYLSNKHLIQFFFKNIAASNIFLTTTDLGNNEIKKNSKVNNYIYYFHSPVSTTKNYTPKAFDNYDTILCNGQFQKNEIQLRENLKKLKPKNLVNSGYLYYDYLLKNINFNTNKENILVAPSWNYALKNFINENFIEIIDILINQDQKVIFRPHPEHYKRSQKILNLIKKKFNHKNFYFDESPENIYAMENSKCLITDSSGIAIEFMLVLKRPVLYFDDVDKVHNSDFKDYDKIKKIDNEIKNNFGYVFNKQNLKNLNLIIENSFTEFEKKKLKLNSFTEENFDNFGKTKIFLKKNLITILN